MKLQEFNKKQGTGGIHLPLSSLMPHKSSLLDTFIKGIEARPLVLEEFDDKLWVVAVEKVKVMLDGSLIFSFKDGTEIEV